jgi:hypothetical protein
VLAVLVLGWIGMLAVQGLVFTLVHGLGIPDAGALTRDPLVLGVSQILGLTPSLWVARRMSRARLDHQSAGRADAASIALVFLAGGALQFVLGALVAALGDGLPVFSIDPASAEALAAAVRIDSLPRAFSVPFCVVLAAPLTEELLFRGAIMPALVQRHGSAVGLLASALLFGAFHLHPVSIVYASLAGLVLGAVALRSRSILPSFTLHAGFNAIPILLPESVLPIAGFNTGDEHSRLSWWILIAASGVAVIALAVFARRTD